MNFIKKWFRRSKQAVTPEDAEPTIPKWERLPQVTKVDEVVWTVLRRYPLSLPEDFSFVARRYKLVAGDLELIQTLGSSRYLVVWKKQPIGWTDDARLNEHIADRGNVLVDQWIEKNSPKRERTLTAEDVLEELKET